MGIGRSVSSCEPSCVTKQNYTITLAIVLFNGRITQKKRKQYNHINGTIREMLLMAVPWPEGPATMRLIEVQLRCSACLPDGLGFEV